MYTIIHVKITGLCTPLCMLHWLTCVYPYACYIDWLGYILMCVILTVQRTPLYMLHWLIPMYMSHWQIKVYQWACYIDLYWCTCCTDWLKYTNEHVTLTDQGIPISMLHWLTKVYQWTCYIDWPGYTIPLAVYSVAASGHVIARFYRLMPPLPMALTPLFTCQFVWNILRSIPCSHANGWYHEAPIVH